MQGLISGLLQGKSSEQFCRAIEQDLLQDQLGRQPLERLLNLMLVAEYRDRMQVEEAFKTVGTDHVDDSSIYRA